MPPSVPDGGLTVGQRIGLLETTMLRHEDRIDRMESWRDELIGAMHLVKFTLGTSIVSGVLAVVTLVLLIVNSGGRPT